MEGCKYRETPFCESSLKEDSYFCQTARKPEHCPLYSKAQQKEQEAKPNKLETEVDKLSFGSEKHD
ncbi:hypothetical protein K8R33_02250 [archaeon]|nr:hypothetical protein [archaeon]